MQSIWRILASTRSLLCADQRNWLPPAAAQAQHLDEYADSEVDDDDGEVDEDDADPGFSEEDGDVDAESHAEDRDDEDCVTEHGESASQPTPYTLPVPVLDMSGWDDELEALERTNSRADTKDAEPATEQEKSEQEKSVQEEADREEEEKPVPPKPTRKQKANKVEEAAFVSKRSRRHNAGRS
eukprot:m.128353 g.128353  ORF g.128353 m.128353 type:complete len:183 (+) comp52291_c0_seq2:1879-2427(+)